MRVLIVFLALWIFATAVAEAAEAMDCPLPAGTKSTAHLKDFPPALLKRMPGLGDSDGPFQTDAVAGYNNLPSNNLIWAFSRNDR